MNLDQSGWRKPQTSQEEKAQFLKDWAGATWDDPQAASRAEQEWARRNPEFAAPKEIDVAGRKMSAEDFQKIAAANGWRDPTKVKLDNIREERVRNGSSQLDPMYRMDGEEGRLGQVTRNDYVYGNSETSDDTPIKGREWVIDAGELKGQKRHTRVKYGYDEKGNFTGVSFDADEKGLEGAAPLLGILTAAIGGGLFGGFSGIGNAAASSIGQTLSPLAAQATGGAIVGGVGAGITNQNVLKGAALGGLGAGVEAMNPGGMLGLDGNAAMAVNKMTNIGAKSAITGKKPTAFGTLATVAGGWK